MLNRLPVSTSGFEEYMRLMRKQDGDMAYFALIDSVGLGSLKNTHEMKQHHMENSNDVFKQ